MSSNLQNLTGFTLPGFERFSFSHLGALFCIAVAVLLAVILGRRTPLRFRRWIGFGLAAAWGSIELYWIADNLGACERTRDCLPLHMCDISVIVGVLALATHWKPAFEFLYFFGLGGTAQALATPDLPFGFPSEPYFQFFVGHGGIIIATAYLIAAFELRPYWLSVRRMILVGYGYLGVISTFNWLAGTNYAYTCRTPPLPTLFDRLGPWPWYVFFASLIAVANILILYLPFWWIDRRNARKQRNRDACVKTWAQTE